jgi:hypothetical protein
MKSIFYGKGAYLVGPSDGIGRFMANVLALSCIKIENETGQQPRTDMPFYEIIAIAMRPEDPSDEPPSPINDQEAI